MKLIILINRFKNLKIKDNQFKNKKKQMRYKGSKERNKEQQNKIK